MWLVYNNSCLIMSFCYLFKYILVGDQSVGKSSVLLRFTDELFSKDCETTIGVEFASKSIQLKDLPIKLQIWDTAGQETFHSITRSYYRGTIAGFLVYDVSSSKSFMSTRKWLEEARNYATTDNILLVLVANKIDLDNREVTTEEGSKFAEENGLMFFECSAKLGKGIDELFMTVSQCVLNKIQLGQIDPRQENGGVRVGDYKPSRQKPTRRCC